MGDTSRKAGLVCSIRVSPEDAMAIADLVRVTEQYQMNMNFSGAVSCALRTMISWIKSNNIVPERTGFEYSDVMRPFANKRNTWGRASLNTTPVSFQGNVQPASAPAQSSVPSKERAQGMLDALQMKGRKNWDAEDDFNWIQAYSVINVDQPVEYPSE